ncbi:hypothetical protein HDE_01997 [Halotydeus destructor]|nr:hypothetical protein HDE_01997 [Halotydeus destructor]
MIAYQGPADKITWKLYLAQVPNVATACEIVLSRQHSNQTDRDAIIVHIDVVYPSNGAKNCIYTLISGNRSNCVRDYEHSVFDKIPGFSKIAFGGSPVNRSYIYYEMISPLILTYPSYCPKKYYLAPINETISLEIRRRQIDKNSIFSNITVNNVDMFNLGVPRSPSGITIECYGNTNTSLTTVQNGGTNSSTVSTKRDSIFDLKILIYIALGLIGIFACLFICLRKRKPTRLRPEKEPPVKAVKPKKINVVNSNYSAAKPIKGRLGGSSIDTGGSDDEKDGNVSSGFGGALDK